MATVAPSPAAPNMVPAAGLNASIRDVTFSTSYATGGEAIAPAQTGLSTIYFAHANLKSAAGSVTQAYYNGATGKLQAFTAAGEVANATNLGALTCECVFYGKQ